MFVYLDGKKQMMLAGELTEDFAKLIAAAPDMRDALERAATVIGHPFNEDHELCMKALKKAGVIK